MDLSNAATDVLSKQRDIVDHIQTNILSGEMPTDIIAVCSPTYFDAYVTQAGVKDAYKYFTSTQNPNRDGLWSQFRHGALS